MLAVSALVPDALMNSTKLPIIYTVDMSQGEREDFPGAMTLAWDQEWQAESPGRGAVQAEDTAAGKA